MIEIMLYVMLTAGFGLAACQLLLPWMFPGHSRLQRVFVRRYPRD